MKTYNISIDKVVRHYDASRKNCPQTMNDNGDWTKWLNFKQKVQEMINDMTNVDPIVEVDQEFKDNLDYLVSYGKINSPSYWLTNCVPNGKVDGMYAKVILTKLAELLKNNTY
jgi:N-acetylmuramoyl-L-alanine amidase